MKFRDGMWLTAEGVRVEYAEEVYNIKKTGRGLSLLCPTKKIQSRGDTLNLSTLTIVCFLFNAHASQVSKSDG
jgi:alpha-D-xyloside xylohydrolase